LTRVLTRSRSVGSRSKGYGGLRAAGLIRGVGSCSDGAGCEQAAGRRCASAGGGRRQHAAAGGGVAHGFELGGLGLMHKRHQHEAQTMGNLTRAARTARSQRRRRSTRRRGSVRRRTPASPPRRLDARERQRAAPGSSSPPCAAPGWLLDGKVATAARTRRRRRGLGFRARAAQEAAAQVLG
jgi:hypothetical protein